MPQLSFYLSIVGVKAHGGAECHHSSFSTGARAAFQGLRSMKLLSEGHFFSLYERFPRRQSRICWLYGFVCYLRACGNECPGG